MHPLLAEETPYSNFFQNPMKPNLALFLELGGSFEEWNDIGFFSREVLLYNKLARECFGTIYIITYGNETDLSYSSSLEENIVVLPRGRRSRSYINNFLYELWLPFKYYRTLGRCDIFRTNQNSGSIAAAIAKLLFRKKRLIVRSGYLGSELARRSGLSILVKGYYFLAENLSYRLCDRALITTEANQHLLLQKYPFMEERVIVHNNFIDTNHFKKHSNARKQYDIIYVARYDRDKNHRAILDALKSTLRSALFIGQGKTLPSIEAEAAKDGTRVSFVKSVRNDDLPALYNAARICAFPSLHEGSPKSLLEAMACELPVAALHAPGVSNVINDRQNGLIGNQHLFAGNIERLLNDHALCDRLGQSARQTVLADYSFKKISSGEIQLYQKLLGL